MLTDACRFFYECGNCKTLLRHQAGATVACSARLDFSKVSADSATARMLRMTIRTLDHFVVGGTKMISFAERGLL